LQNELNCPMIEVEAVYPRKLLADTNELAVWGAYCQGIGMMNKGDWNASETSFDKVIARSPSNAVAYFYRGQAKQAKGDSAGARIDYDKAIELNPELKLNVATEVHLLDVASHVDPTNGK
jgi:Flp pilus assembly protein TadD